MTLKFTKNLFSKTFLGGVFVFLNLTFPSNEVLAQSDNCADATLITTSGVTCVPTDYILLSNTYSASPEAKSSCSFSKNKDAWFKFTATSETQIIKMYDINMDDPNVYSYSLSGALYSGACGTMVEVGCGRSKSKLEGGQYIPKDFMFSADGLTIGAEYHLRINADASTNFSSGWYWADTIHFKMCIQDAVATSNDECEGAISLTRSELNVTNFHATQSMAPMSTCAGFPTGTSGKDLWFKFTSATTGNVEVLLDQADIDIVAQAFSGVCGSLTSIGCTDMSDTLKFMATEGEEYFVRVYGYAASDTGVFGIKLLGDGALPVSLISFDVKQHEAFNKLHWTATSDEMQAFILQHSFNGNSYLDIGKISNNLEADGIRKYEFDHYISNNITHYYRLKIEGKDQTISYSKILKLDNKIDNSAMLIMDVSPNPTKDKVQLRMNPSFKENVTIFVVNSLGIHIQTLQFNQNQDVSISLASYPAGLYFVKCLVGNKEQVVKVIKE